MTANSRRYCCNQKLDPTPFITDFLQLNQSQCSIVLRSKSISMASQLASNRPVERPAPLTVCPTPPESISFPIHWYRIPDEENFLICTKCYEEKLYSSPFASLLRCDYLDYGPGAIATCDFNTPRTDSLLRQAIASNDFQLLTSFAKRRMNIKSCQGVQGIKGGNDVKWFKPVHDDISGFVCCEACYEDVVLGTNFGPQFVPSPQQQPADAVWACDLAIPSLKHNLRGYARSADWTGFAQAARHRMSLPTCVKDVPALASAKTWFNTVRPSPIPDMTICEACYLDRVGWQRNLAQDFAPLSFGPVDYASQKICDFNRTSMDVCADILLPHGMFDKWHYLASLIMSKPVCSKEGVDDGEWYGLPDTTDATRNVENFDICAACHAGWNQSADWGHLFRRLDYPPGTTRVCDFNPSGPRYSKYINKWNQMYFTRDPAPFISYISRVASLPDCPGTRLLSNATWYGDPSASLLICPLCYEEAVRGTSLASAFPLQNTPLSTPHHCTLYSPLMRSKYAEACLQSSSSQSSLTSLLNFASHRERIYQQTVPQIESFKGSQRQGAQLLEIAHQTRANAIGAQAMYNGFTGAGPPIVHNFSHGIVLHTLNIEQQRRNLQFDPRKPRMMELERIWKEVE